MNTKMMKTIDEINQIRDAIKSRIEKKNFDYDFGQHCAKEFLDD